MVEVPELGRGRRIRGDGGGQLLQDRSQEKGTLKKPAGGWTIANDGGGGTGGKRRGAVAAGVNGVDGFQDARPRYVALSGKGKPPTLGSIGGDGAWVWRRLGAQLLQADGAGHRSRAEAESVAPDGHHGAATSGGATVTGRMVNDIGHRRF